MNFPDTARYFDPPPREFEDREGRTVSLRTYGGFDGENPRPPATDDTFEALVAMYLEFDQADRAQGIPPSTEKRVRSWLATVLAPDCVNVVARADDRLVGHATLVPDDEDEDEEAYELAIFVLGKYQGAGIGTELITALLGAGIERGIERVWLTVERWNAPARHLYRKVGFESTASEGFEVEMSIRLRPDGEPSDPGASGDGNDGGD